MKLHTYTHSRNVQRRIDKPGMDRLAETIFGAILYDDKEVHYVDFGTEMKLWDTEQCSGNSGEIK